MSPLADDQGLWRELAPQTLARLVRRYGADQFDLCEDAVQDALVEAHRAWADDPPHDPLGWLVTTARRRYVDRVRSDLRRREREERVAWLEEPLTDAVTRHSDDALLLLRLCCHPALPRAGQVALTLRAVAGLSTAQIATVYQLPEPTIAQRITRAKQRLREHRSSLRADATGEPSAAVLDVLYLMFTEAHHTTSGAPARDADLATEAIRLTRLLVAALPGSTEARGLLALMLLTEARHPARVGSRGQLIPLEEQDRGRWIAPMLHEGLALLEQATPGATPGPFLVQACIAALHASAPSTQQTDWLEIHALYAVLDDVTGARNPTVRLNALVALAMLEGEETALAALAELAETHPTLPRLESVRAHLLARAGRASEAAVAYRLAIAATVNAAERQYLYEKLHRLQNPRE
ncbi:sigma-70 family RNA polymerase sigma factor [Nocardioides dubius]|uniref:Sigma factor-like helix-turn-helix DNA-binding protein n=1 Tax=Nocardioides dubius TaxID=317019 RepID=A0ABP4EI41_9ACTN